MKILSHSDLLKSIQNSPDGLQRTAPSGKIILPKADEERQPEKTGLQAHPQYLSVKELATLHMLFGTEKPAEMELYGRSKLQHIHKGQLIDLTG